MRQPILVCALLLAIGVALGAQEISGSGQYQGTSSPPPDDQIVTQKPAPGVLANQPGNAQTQQSNQDEDNAMPQPTSADPATNVPAPGPSPDEGTVQVAPADQGQPADDSQQVLNARPYRDDPDGDIVHPVARPGEVSLGTTIRARLLDTLSTTSSQSGDTFRTRVASDVMQGGQILIPAGAEIDGVVVRVSTGHTGGHGTMLLRPQTVILADGQSYKLYADVTGAPGSRTKVGGEGVISPGSRGKKDGFEYGGTVGTGLVAGAVLGGPVGAAAGAMVGAGAVTVHLLMDHPQATLETGTVLLFTLTEPLDLVAAGPANGN